MSPLRIEVGNLKTDRWVKIDEKKPGYPPGTLIHHRDDGSAKKYVVDCSLDDSGSNIYIEEENGDANKRFGLRRIYRLHRDESIIIEIRTNPKDDPFEVRFSHK